MNLRASNFRQAIACFITERRDAKLKGAEAADSAQAAKYDYDTWLADTAQKASNLQAATHVLKATHSDAKGSSLYVPPVSLPKRTELGSHALGTDFVEDVASNAKYLGAYKFLKLEVEGKCLLDWLLQEDADLLAALSDNPDTARAYAGAFCSLQHEADSYASHIYAKQLYWCTGEDACEDAQYILLQPMFPSSLMQAVHKAVEDTRSGEGVIEAREAQRDGKPSDVVIPEYRGLATRKLGGTKPQNISQFNIERGGNNYLLASLPPAWDRQLPRSFLNLNTAFRRLLMFQDMKQLLEMLAKHFHAKYHKPSEEKKRLRVLENRLGATVGAFGAEVRTAFPPGWTRDEHCQLPLCEQLWLDPARAELPSRDEVADPEGYAEDQAFKAAWSLQEWPDEIAEQFAFWVSQWLREHGIPVDDAQKRRFAREVAIDADWPNPIRRDLPSKRDWYKDESV